MPRDCCAFKATARAHGAFEGPVGDNWFKHDCKGWDMGQEPQTDVAVGIDHDTDLMISKKGVLFVKRREHGRIAFVSLFKGRITKLRIDFLIECLQRLRTFAD